MKEEKKENKNKDGLGTIKINNEVIATIAGRAAAEARGVAGMSGGVVDGLVKILGRKNPERGIKAEVSDDDIDIDISIVAEYGVNIPDVCTQIQKDVKNKVEAMTGKRVRSVDVNVQGVHFPIGDKTFVEEEK